MKNFNLNIDDSQIALIEFNVPEKSMNTISKSVMLELEEIVENIKNDEKIKGAVIFSGKESGFCAGADLEEISSNMVGASLEDAFKAAFMLNATLRKLETCGKPIACAIEGLALGGGLEIALACHYRVVANDEKIQLGLPECKVGLIPGGGGTQRLPRLMGVQNAAGYLLEGKSMKPQDALKFGVVNEVVEKGKTVEACEKWLLSAPKRPKFGMIKVIVLKMAHSHLRAL